MRLPFRPLSMFAVTLAAGLAVAVGCARNRGPEPVPPAYLTAKVVTDVAAPPGTYRGSDLPLAEVLAPAAVNTPPDPGKKPLNVLALSGGGQYGAFVAGTLCGWTDKGTRPEFDVVTGISSGALIASLAFVGPKYDCELRRVFTTLRQEDLFKYQPARQLIKYKAIATSEPLQKNIAMTISDEYVADLRAAHATGRRLFVGTMNVHSRRLVIWDLGALASCGRPDATDLVRKVLLATSSIGALTPAVEFAVEVDGVNYLEEHVDGGGASQVFVRFGPHHPRHVPGSPEKWLAGSNLYLIAGGKLYADPVAGDLGFIARATSGISATLYALYRAELHKLYGLCAASGMKYHFASIPVEKKTAAKSMAFDPVVMQDLFALGHGYGTTNIPWRHTPPGGEPGEEEMPRAGFRFEIQQQ
ncbi:MAG: patatin-like phospholipase family protein [Fimbriiglobus sp.]